MKKIIFTILFCLSLSASAHEMQHGFIISDDSQYFTHLVATGHHSYQASASGTLTIPDEAEANHYAHLRTTQKDSYFLFQAQKLNLPALQDGQMLEGHIIESKLGDYEPKNIVIQKAQIKIRKLLLKVANPFFTNP